MSRILQVPVGGLDHYVKFAWPPLNNMASTLDICRKFSSKTSLVQHLRVLKREMSPLHQLYLMWYIK